MAETEDKLLHEYFQKLNVEAEGILDVKLDSAIRRGMQQGNRKSLSFRKRYAAGIVVALAILLLIIIPWVNQIKEPVRAQLPPKSWGSLEIFRPTIGNNLTIQSALDAGIMKEVNISSDEVDGIKWTVNGIMADRRGIALLYTIENNTKQQLQFMGLSLKKKSEHQFDLTGYSTFSDSRNQESGSPGTTRMLEQVVWDKYRDDLTDELNVTLSFFPVSEKSSWASSDIIKLSVKIPLKADYNYFKGELVDVKKSLSIGGQTITMDNVYIGPTGIYMRETFGRENTMRIFNFRSTKLFIGKGEHQDELMGARGAYSVNGGLKTYLYQNDNRRPDDPIKFEVEGIAALDQSKIELVINTETKQILKSPDNNLTISKRTADEEEGVILLDLFMPKQEEEGQPESGFSIDDTFVDSEGSGHWQEHNPDLSVYREYREEPKGSTTTHYLYVGQEKLPQPLTFRFSYYPNIIKGTDSIRIR